jgi:predicted DCC family thiol-disulfide oxidoreductase YuxK
VHSSQQAFSVKLLYDGDCPLCVREARLLERMNLRGGGLALENIAAPDFDAARYGLTQAEVMGHIHAVLPDGSTVTGVEAFRCAYAAAGYGFLLAPTRLPGVKQLADLAYAWFARNRLRLTGRTACDTGSCRVG